MSNDKSEDQIQFADTIDGFRQPMVTSIGIILAFLLAFLASWAAEANGEPAVVSGSDWMIVTTLLASAALFTLTLYRMLDNRVFAHPGVRYRKTLRIYLGAIVLAFLGLGSALFL